MAYALSLIASRGARRILSFNIWDLNLMQFLISDMESLRCLPRRLSGEKAIKGWY